MTLQLPSGVKLPRIEHSNSKRFVYDHDVDILQVNLQTLRTQTRISKQLKDRPVKQRGKSQNQHKKLGSVVKYNKWYIDPAMRYISVPKNPKQDTTARSNPQYIYSNLHNQQFWNWVHPLEAKSHSTQLERNETIDKNKLNLRILQDFKKSMQQSRKRVPLVVEQMLSKR